MAELEPALTAYLLSQTELTALIEGRLFYDDAPQDTAMPYVIALCVDNVFSHTHQGKSEHETPNYQFNCYASTRAGARTIAEQVKTTLSDYVGAMGELYIEWIKLVNELPFTENNADGTFRARTIDLEFEIKYIRS